MAHFYGTIANGAQRESTRCGHANGGLVTHAAGWGGAIRTTLSVEDGHDMFRIELVPWQNSGGVPHLLAEGILATADRNPKRLSAILEASGIRPPSP